MKIAVSSASFSNAIARGAWTQLEWLDACANELEVDGVVLDLRDFPRTDAEYLAQIKKSATDLGVTIAAIATSEALPTPDDFAAAVALGAPLAIGVAPTRSDDPGAWSAFVAEAKACARAAKAANVVVALANTSGTLCADAAGLRQIAYDVDGSWLRYALDPLAAAEPGDLDVLLPKAVIARASIGEPSLFACGNDERAQLLIRSLARFRGFVVLESDAVETNTRDYHAAIARFMHLRATFLSNTETVVAVKT
jgi:hypothetical protein